MKRAAPALLLLLLLLALAACAESPVPEGAMAVDARLIEEEPEPLDVGGLFRELEHADFDFADLEERRAWQITRARGLEGEGGWALHPDLNLSQAAREVELSAGEVEVVELELEGPGPRAAQLYWAGEGETFSQEREIRAERQGEQRGRFVFEVGADDAWRGEIRRLRLSVWSHQEFKLLRLRALERQLDEERLAVAAEKPWRVAVNDDRRPARLVLPGTGFEHALDEVAEGSRLSFAFAVHETGEHAVTLRLEAGDAGRTLFEERIEAGAPARWRRAEVELGAAGAVSLRFVAETEGRVGEDVGFPLVAHPAVLSPATSEPPPNVVLIVIDTLRADRLSLYGYERLTTPNLDSWARGRAVAFRRAVAPAGWTLPSHASLFSGVEPFRHGVYESQLLPASMTTLAESLWRRGYATEAITGGAYVDYRFGFDRGFDSYRSWRRASNQEKEPIEGIERSLEALKRLRDRPFFLFFHTYAVHAPYRSWQPWFERFSDLPDDLRVNMVDDDPGPPLERTVRLVGEDGQPGPLPPELASLPSDQYDSGIARLDELLVPLLERLTASDLERRTVVVVTSDHGEMFGEQGVYDHGYLYDPNLLVPLLVATPGVRPGFVDRQVRLVDVAPTLVELTGGEPLPGADGVSLVSLLEGGEEAPPPVAWAYGSRVEQGLALRYRDRYKLLVHDAPWPDWAGREEAFELDPRGAEERLEAVPENLQRFVDVARRQLTQQLPGLRARLTNRTDQVLRIELRGQPVSVRTVKTPALSCGCVTWNERGHAEVLLPPGGEELLIFTHVESDHLRMRLEPAGGPVFDQAVAVPEASGRSALVLGAQDGTPPEWRLTSAAAATSSSGDSTPPPADSSALAALDLWWLGQAPSAGAGEDPEVTEQLRALGYVE